MKSLSLVIVLIAFSLGSFSQNSSIQETRRFLKGEPPYEMQRRNALKNYTFDISDTNLWKVSSAYCKSNVIQTQEQLLSANSYSSKIEYTTDSKQVVMITMYLKKSLDVQSAWNCLNIWSYGDCWGWNSNKKVLFYVLFKDKAGNETSLPLPNINYQYWFLNHLKFTASQYKSFLGFKFVITSAKLGEKNAIYLSNLSFYQEQQNKVEIRSFPSKLPFPLHQTTILPPMKVLPSNMLRKTAKKVEFISKGHNGKLAYRMNGSDFLNGDIEVLFNDRLIQTITQRKIVFTDGIMPGSIEAKDVNMVGDTLCASYQVKIKEDTSLFTMKYTLKNQSLIVCVKQPAGKGMVESVDFGTLQSTVLLHQLPIPFMTYSYRASDVQRPWLFYNNALFTLVVPDWYVTNASRFVGGMQRNGVFWLGRAEYSPKTDGLLNKVNEKVFYNISPTVEEVFPAIDNPSSSYGKNYKDRVGVTAYGADLKYMLQRITTLQNMGVTKADVRFHEDTWRATGESFTLRTAPNPSLTVNGIRSFLRDVKNLGWNTALYTNYSDFAPVSAVWNPDWVARKSDGNWLTAWMRCYALKPQSAWEQEAVFAPKIKQLYNPNFSYCDVMTAVSPNERLDFDSRMPDAGMMRGTYERYAMLLMNERKSYGGPVFSEGGTHWWYAGLVDGNYGNDRVLELPVFPDFNLLRIHPLEMDMGYMGEGYMYLAYTLAYGQKSFFNLTDTNEEIMRRYAMLQPIQKDYVMVPVSSIQYFSIGKFHNTSDAIRSSLLSAPQLRIVYQSGMIMYVNFGEDNWTVNIGHDVYMLPQYGFVVCNMKTGVRSSSILTNDGTRCDEVYSSDLYYLDTRGREVKGRLGGNGCYMIQRKQKTWEIIPIANGSHVRLDLSLLGMEQCKLQGLDKNKKVLNTFLFHDKVDVTFASGVVKYQLIQY